MNKNNKGLTLIELVLSIVIIAICFIPVATMYQQVLSKIYRSRVVTIAGALAEEKMDEVSGKNFLNINDEGPASFSNPFGDYSYEVVVHYVQPGNLNTSVDPTVTDYKNIEVRISHSEIGTMRINSLVTNH